MKISENDIKRICSDGIYRSGLGYFKESRVHIRVRSEESIVASVDGDRLYNVHIGFDENGKISETFCTCPYYQTMSAACKHIVATLKTRQAELEKNDDFEDGNDILAGRLCREFEEADSEKTHINVDFAFNINTNHKRKCTHSVSLRLAGSQNYAGSCEEFLNAYITGGEYKLSKHKSYENSKFSIDSVSREILDILAEALENKLAASGFYTAKTASCEVGDLTAKRLLPLMARAKCAFLLNGMPQTNMAIKDEDPDILVDVTATDENIGISVIQSGLSVVEDGSWFLYDGDLYKTTPGWRSWYMPIYRALAAESRTQLDFKGNNSVAFAANVLPKLKNQKGVILQGVENVIIDGKPLFDIYLDESDGGITAAVTVSYGSITLRLPETSPQNDKIIVRDHITESAVLSFFAEFSGEGAGLYLSDSGHIYDFMTASIKKLSDMARVLT